MLLGRQRVHFESLEMVHFICEVCNKEFTCRKNVKRHTLTVHRRTARFKCKMCNYHSTRRDNLFRHKSKTHRDRSIEDYLLKESDIVGVVQKPHRESCRIIVTDDGFKKIKSAFFTLIAGLQ